MKIVRGVAAILVAGILSAFFGGFFGEFLVHLSWSFPSFVPFVSIGQAAISWSLFILLTFSFLRRFGAVSDDEPHESAPVSSKRPQCYCQPHHLHLR